MLQRLQPPTRSGAPSPRATLRQRRASALPWACAPAQPGTRRWLKASGSLTARLRQHGHVQVQVLSQGTQRLSPQERRALRLVSGHVREVILLVDGVATVWARSVTSPRALRGPWKALKGLGSRPLAELLFSHARVVRGPLHRHAWRHGGAEHQRALRHWPRKGSPPPRWARASVFEHHGQRLRVMESFSPRVVSWRP